MIKKLAYLLLCLFIGACNCSNNKNNQDVLYAMDEAIISDNYLLLKLNQKSYNLIYNKYLTDTIKYSDLNKTAFLLKNYSDSIDYLFRYERATFISKLTQSNNFVAADTVQLKYLSNKDEYRITSDYFLNNFKPTLEKAKKTQQTLNGILKDSCNGMLQSIDDIWADYESISAEKFIINISLTQNRLQKKINCLLTKINLE